MKIYALKDNKLGFMSPIVLNNDDLAVRHYSNLINDPGRTMVSVNPEDFDLYSLGTYDQESGKIVSKVEFVANHLSIKK